MLRLLKVEIVEGHSMNEILFPERPSTISTLNNLNILPAICQKRTFSTFTVGE